MVTMLQARNTTIESGMGKFNLVKRRDGNSYVSIQSYDLLAVGSDNAGDRVASNSIYKRYLFSTC